MSLELVEKRCPTCGEVKPLSGFHRNRRNSDGHTDKCKPCANAYVKEQTAKKRRQMGDEAYLAHQREIVRRHRERTGNRNGKLYSRAVSLAQQQLAEAHRDEYEARLRLALDALRREAKV